MKALICFCILALSVSSGSAQLATSKLNLGFEEATCDGRPAVWVAGSSEQVYPFAFRALLDEQVFHSGRRSLHLQYIPGGGYGFGVATDSLPVAGLRGNTARISGWIRTAKVRGFAGLWLRVTGEGKRPIAFNNMNDSAFGGTNDWTRFSFDLPVADSAESVYFGVLLAGTGDAWYDDLNIEVIQGISEAEQKRSH